MKYESALLWGVFLCFAGTLTSASWLERQVSAGPDWEPRFTEVFVLVGTHHVTGESGNPISSGYRPTRHENLLYIPDFVDGQIRVFDISYEARPLLANVQKTSFEQLQMPYGIAVSRYEHMFINERAASNVRVLHLETERSFNISHAGITDELYVVVDQPQMVTLWLVGPARCPGFNVCSSRLLEIDLLNQEIKSDRTFDEYAEALPIMTWTGSFHPGDNLFYVGNVASNNVSVYDSTLRRIRTLTLEVPQSVPLRYMNGDDITHRNYAYDRPRMNRLVVLDEMILVQWIASAPEADSYRFVVSGYDRMGNVVIEGVATDLHLAGVQNETIVFSSYTSVSNGRVDVYEFELAQGF